MSSLSTVFCEPASIVAARTLLFEKLGWTSNRGQLDAIPQWAGFLKSIEYTPSANTFTDAACIGGYFYNFHNPAPTADALAKQIEQNSDASAYLVPTVPHTEDTQALSALGFSPAPAYIESIFDIEGTLEEALRKSIGSRRYLDFERITRKAEAFANVRFYRSAELKLNPQILEIAGRVHAENARKYNQIYNPYDTATLKTLLTSTLGANLVIGIVSTIESDQPVQVILALLDSARGHAYYLAQGIDHAHVPETVNLYTASYLWLYRFAVENTVHTVFLSRGMHDAKRRLGANRFLLLNHWLRSDSDTGRQAISEICERANRKFKPAFEALVGDSQ